MMNDLNNLLKWYADQAGMRLLEICQNPQEGFEDVVITVDKSFYGIHSSLTPDHIETINHENSENFDNLFTEDFPREFIPRFFRIATDIFHRSKIEGFEFYNGTLARFIDASVKIGRSPHQPILNLKVGGTSYFTAVATNIHIRGYEFRYLQKPNEPCLPKEADWVSALNWRESIKTSSLANALAIHLFLYNDQEIIYVRRGKVGQSSGLWNSTVNGVMEFASDNPDIVSGKPDIRATAVRETLYELNMEIKPQNIKWIGLVASKDRCEAGLIGVCKTHLSKSQIAKVALEGREQREIGEKSKSIYREKEFRAIFRNWDVKAKDISFGVGSLTIPYHISSPTNLSKMIREKILQKKERVVFQRDSHWTDSGATALLLCLAHLSNQNELINILASIKEKYLKRHSSE